MHLRLRLVCLCLSATLFAHSNVAQAQTPGMATGSSFILPPDTIHQEPETEQEPQQAIQKEKPYRLLRTAGITAAGATAWALTFAYIDEPAQQFMQSHRCAVADGIANVVQPLGRQRYLAPAAGVAFVSGLLAKDEQLQKAGLISLGSIFVNTGVTSTLKKAFHRHRPSATTENHEFDGPFWKSPNASLPSSHTSTAFAVATSVATVYRDSKYVPPIAYGVATLVGLSRINDNAHWVTDVMAGAAIGYLSSKGVGYLYSLTDEKLGKRRQKLLLTPQIGLTSAQFSATLVF